MFHPRKNIAAALAIALLAATSAYASDSLSEINQRKGSGDPVSGKEKSALCQGCHGEDGNSASPIFPKLAGQWSDYIQKQFRNFQNLARINETMNEVAINVNDFEDLFDIAAYFSSQKMMAGEPSEGAPAENALGKKLYYEGNGDSGAFRCFKCHGERGRGEPLNNNLFPVIGGQHKDYLIKQLKEFKSGFRENDPSGMMARITSHLSFEEIEALADYLSVQEPNP